MQGDRRPPSPPLGAVSSLRLQQAAAAALVAKTCPKRQPQTSRQYVKYLAQDGGLSSWSDSCAAVFCSSHTSGNLKTSFQKRNDLIIKASFSFKTVNLYQPIVM